MNDCVLAVEDFGPPQSYIVTFPIGSIRQSVNISINDDNIDEGDERFQLEISVPEAAVTAGVVGGCGTSLVVLIIDDDGMFCIAIKQGSLAGRRLGKFCELTAFHQTKIHQMLHPIQICLANNKFTKRFSHLKNHIAVNSSMFPPAKLFCYIRKI